jgi:dTMP kinase
VPDCTFFLDLEIEVARNRGGFGEERYEQEQLQRRVRELFHRFKDESNWTVSVWMS